MMKALNRQSAFALRDFAAKLSRRASSLGLASFFLSAVFLLGGGLLAPRLQADTHTLGVPQLNSRPGAAYTIYLDFAGFNFTGTWGTAVENYQPGNTPSYNGASGTFSAANQTEISGIWARVAQCYTPFNVNVTTIDPAVAAGQADTDAHRQSFYDQTPNFMHTVIGQQQNNWCGNYGGISYVGVTPWTYDTSVNNYAGYGWKTNWVFSNVLDDEKAWGQAAAHENGHGLSLSHQSDYSGGSLKNEYSRGYYPVYFWDSADYAPIMGNSYESDRGAWRVGDSNNGQAGHNQNDISVLLSNPGFSYVDDQIGHTIATATPLPLTGGSVNAALAKGVIMPNSAAAPTPIGASNYTTDYFLFRTGGGPISLTVNDGSELLNPGTADPGAMLRSTLQILNGAGVVVGSGADSAFSETYSGTLPAGDYYAKIASYGGKTQTIDLPWPLSDYNTTYYYDMGSYFLSGSGFIPVPEPTTFVLLAAAATGIIFLRRPRRK